MLAWVRGLEIDSKGNLYLGDIMGKRVQRLDRVAPEPRRCGAYHGVGREQVVLLAEWVRGEHRRGREMITDLSVEEYHADENPVEPVLWTAFQ